MPIYKGNTKIVKLYKGSTQIVKRYKGTNLIYSVSRLPSEFQKVEYLESTGTQYINTQYTSNDSSKIKLIIGDNSNVSASRYGYIFSTQNDNSVGARYIENANQIRLGFNTTTWITSNVSILSKNTLVMSFSECSFNGSSLPFNVGSNYSIISLFGTINENKLGKIRLFACQIYNNNILVRDFVPCYRKADNVAGLYDLVNGVFYTNAGTGSFIVGGNV